MANSVNGSATQPESAGKHCWLICIGDDEVASPEEWL
jgi:hypothetical protein